jgi:hypothetical protein
MAHRAIEAAGEVSQISVAVVAAEHGVLSADVGYRPLPLGSTVLLRHT